MDTGRVDVVSRQALGDRAAGTASDDILLDGYKPLMGPGQIPDQGLIERLDETHIDYGGADLLAGLEDRCKHRSKRQNGDTLPLPAQFCLTNRQGRHLPFDNPTGSSSTWIPHRGRLIEKEAGVEHLPAFI